MEAQIIQLSDHEIEEVAAGVLPLVPIVCMGLAITATNITFSTTLGIFSGIRKDAENDGN